MIAEAIEKTNAKDPVLHTTADGVEIRKSDGATTLALAKQLDAQSKETSALKDKNTALAKAAELVEFEKRASTELRNLPGTINVRAQMLKAAESLEDEDDRKAAVAMLKAQNASMASAFVMKGVTDPGAADGGGEAAGTDQDQLDALTVKHQEANTGMSFAKAQADVLQTEEGAALYGKIAAADAA